MSDFEKFKEELPSKKKFYSSLTDRKVAGKIYEHALNDWKNIEMETMKDYHDLYLKCDVLLLANVCEKCRNNSLKNHGLCPSYYLSVTGLSWDAMLKMTKTELELITDLDLYIFFEKGTRGEISYISNRYSKTNKKYLKSYDPKEGAKHILYGYAMSKFLPTSRFIWIDPKEVNLNKYQSKWLKQYIELNTNKE